MLYNLIPQVIPDPQIQPITENIGGVLVPGLGVWGRTDHEQGEEKRSGERGRHHGVRDCETWLWGLASGSKSGSGGTWQIISQGYWQSRYNSIKGRFCPALVLWRLIIHIKVVGLLYGNWMIKGGVETSPPLQLRLNNSYNIDGINYRENSYSKLTSVFCYWWACHWHYWDAESFPST